MAQTLASPANLFLFDMAAGKEGAFGASLLEMDHEVGRVMGALKASNVDDNTLVMVTGDNGNWECKW